MSGQVAITSGQTEVAQQSYTVSRLPQDIACSDLKLEGGGEGSFVGVLQRAILQQQSASRKWVSWSNSFFPCGLCESSQTCVEHRVIALMIIFFFSAIEMNVFAMKFGHPSVTL